MLASIREEFRTAYLPVMMDPDGSFPKELARTKPYGYSLFMIDAMAGVAQIASTPEDDLWAYEVLRNLPRRYPLLWVDAAGRQ